MLNHFVDCECVLLDTLDKISNKVKSGEFWGSAGSYSQVEPDVSESPTLCAIAHDMGAVDEFGNRYWKVDGKHHRLEGPAILEASGTKLWMQNDVLHRLDGMAVEYPGGAGHYSIEGKSMTEQEFHNDPRVIQAQAHIKTSPFPSSLSPFDRCII